MEAGTIAMIATAVLALVGVLGFLPKVLKIANSIKESIDVVLATLSALSDGKITPEEVAKIKEEIKEASDAWKSKE